MAPCRPSSPVVAFLTLRSRRELWIGAAVLTVQRGLELDLGGFVSEQGSRGVAAVHIPLALAIISIAVWLPLRARHAAPT